MEEVLIALLQSDSGVAALVGTRVYPVSRPQESALPAITASRISGGPLYTDVGQSGLAEARLQIDCWGESYSSAKRVARAVIASLYAFAGTVEAVTFQTILLDAERDLREGGGSAPDYPFRTSLDFNLWFKS